MNDWTPLPGTALKNDESIEIIKEFRAKYRIHVNGQPDNIPTWCTFPAGVQVDESILDHPQIETERSLYFYVENRNEIYKTKPEQIQDYFSHRNPWEDNWDFYVFNANLAWCIAITHGLADGSAFILVGDFAQ
jgi:hypothetical protein